MCLYLLLSELETLGLSLLSLELFLGLLLSLLLLSGVRSFLVSSCLEDEEVLFVSRVRYFPIASSYGMQMSCNLSSFFSLPSGSSSTSSNSSRKRSVSVGLTVRMEYWIRDRISEPSFSHLLMSVKVFISALACFLS